MRTRRLVMMVVFLALSGAANAGAQTQGAAASAPGISLSVPVMSGPLAFSPVPTSVDAGQFGKWYVDGVFSALGLLQGNPSAGDRAASAGLGDAQVIVQKIDGTVRFYVQLGGYALPALGQTYAHETDAGNTIAKFFDPVPQAFLKIAPSDSFSIQAGKLPTLIGGEYTFDFENVDIVRGLLWTQEPAVSRGIQANYVTGPFGFSLSLNDGFYARRYTWLSGSATWTINPANSLVFAAGANLGESGRHDLATPLDQNNGSIYNLIYTYAKGPLMVSPYVQYSAVPRNAAIGIHTAASLYGGALLASYALTPNVSLGGRLEYENEPGSAPPRFAANLLYGPGSSAASITLTPNYSLGHWFARADFSALAIGHLARSYGLGSNGDIPSQIRSLLEVGYIF